MANHVPRKFTIKERLLAYRELGPNGCWLWQRAISNGYGRIYIPGVGVEYAHIVSYREFVGDVAPGAVVHHRCGVRICFNPAHLELLSAEAHTRLHHPSICPHGAVRQADCRVCSRERKRAWRARRRLAGLPAV